MYDADGVISDAEAKTVDISLARNFMTEASDCGKVANRAGDGRAGVAIVAGA